MKKFILIILLLAGAYFYFNYDKPHAPIPAEAAAGGNTGQTSNGSSADADDLAAAFRNHASGVQVQGRGEVIKVLPDDTEGDKHQKFILRLANGQTILIAHNIDLAARVSPLSEGDTVLFSGEYEWNAKGGLVHWTHKDPAGTHPAGWLERNGTRFN